ncbi:ATP-dependent DNA ligase [Mesorhizobium sp. M4B.F.Ca.ET.215.01.1.1]|uniref:ATP-dependent DNA ligase n=1 Tax=unclassified Mesorhizobium TaxID=325217 RepID=UPI000FCA9523|nr:MULTISPECIES: ATP-dependent DNA ligase [unclassified Mesorhizobium]RUW27481.1 ATP-dependent DNA ligase [Mesorhizobium sp. M4B.F.Ca.ET.013.02.1.1]RVD45861.1 ATP-dependent DNA ligase [Mesorhizobium sp. M4B.F.Ca.ET.019.03.1.1]RWF64664.1 MAG: ATP-dependent DNA ligase [Mesorhizobium sp.]TGQ18360.1 ATP-dependent DNA ligase [Mesorhizobium sp. M4B.F.Ca.ET.215.01.1.1]TGQ37157.1 ATP-dependent DNA ligase [Mesorhizobium sp. M4B.F.Ca.ET.214.01.1.1]
MVAESDHEFPLTVDTPPMEARTADTLPEGNGIWQYEPKWDGFRCLAFKGRKAVDLRAKSGKPLGRYFPELTALLGELEAQDFVVDGEIIIEIEGRASFDALQMRLHPAESRIRKLSRQTPARIVLFDTLAAPGGKIVLERPLRERRGATEDFVARAENEALRLSSATTSIANANKWLQGAGHGSTDGVVAKMLDQPYRPGERAMVKVKRLRTADCVVGGFRYLNRKRQVGSLLLGLYNDNGLLDHVGFTSTISNEDRQAITVKLEELRGGPGFSGKAPGGPSRWSTERSGEWEPVRPELVVEVRFDHITSDRFRHGTRLLRWRPDKAPRQCTFEQIE